MSDNSEFDKVNESSKTPSGSPEQSAPQQPPGEPPPHGPRVRVLLTAAVAVVLAVAAGVKWHSQIGGAFRALKPSAPQAAAAQDHKLQYYTCGMHPQVILPKPGDCPICHMKLVPLDPAKFTTQLAVSPEISQSIGIRTAPVTVGPMTNTIRTVGNVDYNETLVRDVTLKVPGWIEKLHVDYVGKPVDAGQPLFEIYSPELFIAQEEYLNVFREQASTTKPGDEQQAGKWDRNMLVAAHKRLRNLDVSDQQIRELEQRGTSTRTLTFTSPYPGLVISKNIYEGQKVEAGMQLYRIADLSKVWIMVSVYEYQLPFVQVGQKAIMKLPYVPGQQFEGKVTYIYPTLNQETRQVKLRLEFDNPHLLLKPGMFAEVELRSTLANDRIMVPREALVDTGSRQLVFVSLGEGRFEPRTVTVGEGADKEAENGMVVIRDGLKPGEIVVTSGNFLLDSESRIREDIAKMVKGELASEQKVQSAVSGKSQLAALPEEATRRLGAAMDSYFAVGQKLSSDTLEGVPDAARKLAAETDALMKVQIPENPHFWHEHMEVADIRGKALEMIEAKDLVAARLIFADLSTAMQKLLKATGVPASYGKEVQEMHCPMYREGQGGTWWLQVAGETRNPYYGSSMLGCKDKTFSLPVTGASAKE